MNESIRAWNLLKPEERPSRMSLGGEGENRHNLDVFTEPDPMNPTEYTQVMPDATARDRLIVAVEEVLYRACECGLGHGPKGWCWFEIEGDEFEPNHDRLRAANDALEAIRKDDDA